MKIERQRAEQELRDCKKLIRNLPNGRIECHVRGSDCFKKKYNWFYVKDNKRSYLPKTEIELAKRLAYKRTIKKRIGELENKLIAIDVYLDIVSGKGSKYASTSANALAKQNTNRRRNKTNDEIERLSKLYLFDRDKELRNWSQTDYFNWNNHPESLTVKSKTGRIVRSRIEASIDESLNQHGFYYRYEDPTLLDGICRYPDFTIIHPRTKEKIIWEHYGRLDKEDYLQDNIDKMFSYINNGYYPGINLIFTSENNKKTLDLQRIERIIELFLEN